MEGKPDEDSVTRGWTSRVGNGLQRKRQDLYLHSSPIRNSMYTAYGFVFRTRNAIMRCGWAKVGFAANRW